MKKSSFISILTAICLIACAQTRTEIKITGEFLDENPVYIHEFNTHEKIGEGTIQPDGSVIFNLDITEPTLAVIGAAEDGRKPICNIILDNESMIINIAADTKKLVKGSTQNQMFFDAQERMKTSAAPQKDLMNEYSKLHQQYEGNIPDSIMKDLNKRYDEIAEEILSTQKQIIAENSDNLVPIYYMLMGADDLGADFVEDFLKNYKYKDNEALKPVYTSLTGEKNKVIGALVVDFVGKDLEDKECHLTDYVGKGKYVLVDFWASWCGPCRAEMPNVKACYDLYHEKGFDIVGISFDNDKDAWAKSVSDLDITWTQISDLKGWQCEASNIYNIKAIPATILYGPDGKVLKTNLRGEELGATLKQYLDK